MDTESNVQYSIPKIQCCGRYLWGKLQVVEIDVIQLVVKVISSVLDCHGVFLEGLLALLVCVILRASVAL